MTGKELELEFLEYVLKLLVNNPDQVQVTRSVDDLGVLMSVKVAKDDMGRVIGKSGQTAKALRVLLRAIGSKKNERINMKIVDEQGGEHMVGGEEML